MISLSKIRWANRTRYTLDNCTLSKFLEYQQILLALFYFLNKTEFKKSMRGMKNCLKLPVENHYTSIHRCKRYSTLVTNIYFNLKYNELYLLNYTNWIYNVQSGSFQVSAYVIFTKKIITVFLLIIKKWNEEYPMIYRRYATSTTATIHPSSICKSDTSIQSRFIRFSRQCAFTRRTNSK